MWFTINALASKVTGFGQVSLMCERERVFHDVWSGQLCPSLAEAIWMIDTQTSNQISTGGSEVHGSLEQASKKIKGVPWHGFNGTLEGARNGSRNLSRGCSIRQVGLR